MKYFWGVFLLCYVDAQPVALEKHPYASLGVDTYLTASTSIGDLDEDGDIDIVLTDLERFLRCLINDGTGKFEFSPLPRIAQIAPGYGVELFDYNGDTNLDIYMVQNFYGPEPETGHMAGGLSQLLTGDGKGNFEPVSPQESGLVVFEDTKSLTRKDLDGDGYSGLSTESLVNITTDTAGVSLKKDSENSLYIVDGTNIILISIYCIL